MSLLLSKDGSCSDVSAEYKANNTSLPHDENEAEVRSKNRRNPLVSVKQSKVSFSPNISINVSSPDDKGDMDRLAFAQESCKSYNVILVGESVLDRRFTSHMLPWIIAEVVRKKSISLEISLQLTDNSFRVSEPNVNEVLFEHKLKNVCKFSKTLYDHSCFMYLTRESVEEPYKCYVYKAESENVVIELFSKMKEVTKEIIQQQQNSGLLTENNEGLSKSVKYTMQDVQQFEVLYIGKIKVSHKRAPPTFIDDAVEKFKLYEIEKGKHPRERHGSGASITSLPGNIEQKVNVQENNLKHQLDCMESTESLSSGSDASLCLSISRSESSDVFPPSSASDKETNDTPAYNRMRSLSGDNVLCKTVNSTTLNGNSSDNEVRRPRGETWPTAPTLSRQQNRTMLFLIGKSEVCMISPDKKSALLTKSFRDISHCSQGIRHSDHFGFICRETCLEGYISYIFKCQSETVVDDIMLTLKQAFKYAHLQHQQQTNKSGPYVICNTCPMHWLHKVCIEIDGLNPERTNAVLMKKLEKLSEVDQNDILAKLNETEINSKQEKCEVLMIILMAMCRNKQMRHKHCNLTDNTKPEFHLGERRSSTFDNLKKKAKKSLTSSFENMLKRRSKEDVRSSPEKEVEHEILHKKPLPHWKSFDDSRLASIAMQKTSLQGSIKPINENETNSQNQAHTSVTRCRSSTIATVGDGPKEIEQRNENSTTPISPFMNMFMKVGNQVKSPMMDTNLITPKKGSWRQAIFNRVVTPVKTDGNLQDVPESPESRANNSARPPLTKENIRALWRKIIHQQITLIRMEKENKKLQAHQDAYSNKRIKLDYEEITPCLKDVTKVWEGILKSDCLKIFPKNDLLKSVKDGVPRIKRGDIWMFLSKQSAMRNPNAFVNDFDIDIPYSDLLKDLTSHQHAILIDLGRTFPSHPYYSRSLGPGQLGLFNLLKAYSLLDKDVGYCQGLSFVAGVLLLHMEEEDSFNMMKHLMFRIGIRRQYKPDMVALQVQMYQLSRLIHDHHRDLYEHFEMHEIAPTLYAAPWFLTLFASQFPLGFVSRLFDLLLLQDFEVIFKVALILLGNHKELIMQCNGFEPIMEFLKTTLPSLGIIQMERVFNQVFTLDISKQLHAFEVEYHVLQEEMILSPQKTEVAYQNLRRQNMELVEQLQVAHTNIHNLEHSIGSYQDTINRLQAQVKALDLEKSTLQRALVKLEHTPISGSNSTQYINEIINDNKFTSTKSTHYQDKNLNNTDFLSNRQPSNDSSSFDEEDKEVAILNSGSTNSISSKQHASTDSPEVDK